MSKDHRSFAVRRAATYNRVERRKFSGEQFVGRKAEALEELGERASAGAITQERGGRVLLTGFSAVFDVWYTIRDFWGPFQERVDGEAFDETLRSDRDVIGAFNHSPDFVLGRHGGGTMRSFTDEVGLRYEILANPASPAAQTAIAAVEDRNAGGSSIAFEIVRQGWEFNEDTGEEFRTILEARLFEHGPVAMPASPTTTAEIGDDQRADFDFKDSDVRSVALALRRGAPLTDADVRAINARREDVLEALFELGPRAPVNDRDGRPAERTNPNNQPSAVELFELSRMRVNTAVLRSQV